MIDHAKLVKGRWSWSGVANAGGDVLAWDPVRPADTGVAFNKLSAKSLNQALGSRGADIAARIPNSPSWRRIIRNWGDPGYFIGAASPGPSRMYCLKDVGIHVRARIGDEPVDFKIAKLPPYGYSINCEPAGLRFRAPQGAVVQIHFETVESYDTRADLVVVPYWAAGTKDRLVEVSIQQDLHIAPLATVLGALGAVLIAVAAFLFSRRPARPDR